MSRDPIVAYLVALPPEELAPLAAALGELLPPAPAPGYLTIPEAADLFRCKRQRVDDLLSQGALTRVKEGRRTLIARAEIDAHLGVRVARLLEPPGPWREADTRRSGRRAGRSPPGSGTARDRSAPSPLGAPPGDVFRPARPGPHEKSTPWPFAPGSARVRTSGGHAEEGHRGPTVWRVIGVLGKTSVGPPLADRDPLHQAVIGPPQSSPGVKRRRGDDGSPRPPRACSHRTAPSEGEREWPGTTASP